MNRFQVEKKRPCRAIDIVEELEEDLKTDYLEILDDKRISPARIASIMQVEKHPIAAMTILRHRTRQCSCPKSDK